MKLYARVALLFILFQLTGCALHHRGAADGPPKFHIDVSKIHDAVPKAEPLSKYGNPKSYVAKGHRYYVMKSAKGYCETGVASWYGMKFHKIRTSSGDPYNVAAMTAAHRTLPIPTYVQVTNLQNGRRVIVKVNDRGPFAHNRIIDLSYVAAVKLGVTGHGTARVEVRAIDPRSPPPSIEQPTTLAKMSRPSPRAHYVQLGMFVQQKNAEQLAKQVKGKTSYPVVVKVHDQNGQLIFRVCIGPLPNKTCSEQLSRQLQKEGLGKPIVIMA